MIIILEVQIRTTIEICDEFEFIYISKSIKFRLCIYSISDADSIQSYE